MTETILIEEPRADYDSPWKEILERYFQEFLQFFFPIVHKDVDWMQGYEFLDKELQQVTRDAELGRRLVDKLIKVYTKEGKETWVLIHVEVQGEVDAEFAKRMYVYNYRLFDRYDRKVASLAVLADEQIGWRPTTYEYALWNCGVRLQFDVVKLTDYHNREEELETLMNPFAVVVLSYLKTRETKKHPDDRLQWKIRLFKMLYERGYSKENILELTRFIDWIMVLPEEMEQQFDDAMIQIKEEQNMKYIASYEKHWLERGIQQGIKQAQEAQQHAQQIWQHLGKLETAREDVLDIIGVRFEQIPYVVIEAIREIENLSLLKDLHKKAATVGSLEEYQMILKEKMAHA